MLMLGSFLIWLYEVKDLKVDSLVEDLAILVKFQWLK